ncbi:MAG: hypothetical protein UY90_C0098G0006 [Candidatus Peregrinibacteria bacterium GW2011_GWA2_54_9]|nr:MAG: hypothetical protein UY90_C0098G0006 [Candidatus Peregrinibacteria bacterium GW2011_GWA2_54_9]
MHNVALDILYILRNNHKFIHLMILHNEKSCHELGNAGHRPAYRLLATIQLLATFHIHDDNT